jgi:hypothetical protein
MGAMARRRPALDEVAADKAMLALWGKHAKKNPHAAGIELAQCCETAKEVLAALEWPTHGRHVKRANTANHDHPHSGWFALRV